MNSKILTAVLLTLTAAFLFMNTGTNPGNTLPDLETQKEKPTPHTPVKLEITSIPSKKIQVNGDITVQGLKEYTSSKVDIRSKNDILFKNFRGTVRPGNTSSVNGNAQGFTSNGVDVAQGLKLDLKTSSQEIKVERARKTSLRLEEVDLSLSADNSTTQIIKENTTVEIDSFSGNISFRPQQQLMDLEGRIHLLKAGKTIFGSQ
ncbi:MAG: hypothetical protein ABEJ93_02705 [Candidatus Nanohalobium sp.]